MSQPPNCEPASVAPAPPMPPQWRRPRGVAPGTWKYVNERSIADRYDEFVADTPLCHLDQRILGQEFPGPRAIGQPDPAAREVVLDLGCGSGRASLALASRGYDVVAIDLSQSMLQLTARKANASPTTGRVSTLRANLAQLDCLHDQSADHAVCLFSTLGMIQGRVHRQAMLRHVARILGRRDRAGGRLLLHVHNRWSALLEPRGCWQLASSWCQSLCRAGIEFGDAVYSYRGVDEMFLHRFSRREILADLRRCGWRVDVVRPITIDGERISHQMEIPGGYMITATATPTFA